MATTPLPGSGDFPDNSMKAKGPVPKERPEVQKIVVGTATELKPSIWKRIGKSFTGDDARHVGDYVLMDVILPSAKSLISDALTTAVERFFFGDGRGRSSSSYGGYGGGHVSYNRMSSPLGSPPWNTGPQQPQMSRRARATHDFREVLIGDRQSAAVVLDTLTEMVSMYEVATVADFYNAVGFTSEFTDRNWGWNDLRDAQIVRVRDGYTIQMPQPIQIK